METNDCGSRARNRRPGRWHLAIPVSALLFQLVPPVLFWAISTTAYGAPRRLPESWERPASLLAFGFSAGVSLLLGSIGVYGLLTRTRTTVAVLLIVALCVPALLAGAIYLHGLLVFLAWV
jgi:hypothetical protein